MNQIDGFPYLRSLKGARHANTHLIDGPEHWAVSANGILDVGGFKS